MSVQPSRGKFKGALASPISGEALKDALIQADGEINQQNKDALERAWRDIEFEWHLKMPLLFDHYGISQILPEEIRNLLLVFALAQETVPGFMVDLATKDRPKRGRPRKIPPRMLYDFMMLRQAGVGASEAARKLNSKGPWKGMVPRGLNARYSELDRHGGLPELTRRVGEHDRTK